LNTLIANIRVAYEKIIVANALALECIYITPAVAVIQFLITVVAVVFMVICVCVRIYYSPSVITTCTVVFTFKNIKKI